MKISIDGTALKRLQQGLMMSRQELDRSIANNLNSAGDALAEEIAVGLAGELGVPEGAMRGLIYVSRATSTTHRYMINSSAAVGAEPPEFERGARTWRDAARPSDFFKRGELVWMVNPNEDRCDICDDIIEKKLVYTIEEIRAKVGGVDIVPGGYTNVFHVNCMLPDTVVEGNIITASKSFYSGRIVNIVALDRTFSTIKRLSLTVQHPVLTSVGFVPAQNLRKGMQLIGNRGDVRRPVVLNVENHEHQRPTRIDEIFATLVKSGSVWQTAVGENFHGDGRFMDGDVEIVFADRELLRTAKAEFAQNSSDLGFVFSDVQKSFVAGFGSGKQYIERVQLASSSFMRLSDLVHSDTFVHHRPFNTLCIGMAPDLDVALLKRENNSVAVAAKLFGELIDRHSDEVSIYDVVDLTISEIRWRGHVYDLQTTSGYIMANGLAISNCRCYPVPARTIGRLPEKFSPEVSRLRDTERRIIEDYQVRLGDVAGIVLKTVVK